MKKIFSILAISFLATQVSAEYKVYSQPQNNNSGKVITVPEPDYLSGCYYDENKKWYWDADYHSGGHSLYACGSTKVRYSGGHYHNKKRALFDGKSYAGYGSDVRNSSCRFNSGQHWNSNKKPNWFIGPLEVTMDNVRYEITQGEVKVNGSDYKEWEICFSKLD